MIVVLTGGTGFIGRKLTKALVREGHTTHLLSRRPQAVLEGEIRSFAWNPEAGLIPAEAFRGAAAVVHLAGEPIAQRWTAEAQARIRASRVYGTRALVEALSTVSPRPPVLVSASAVGIYGSRGDEVLTETSTPGSGFLAGVCREWEGEAGAAAPLGMRVVLLRTGIALDRAGGALPRMILPFRLGVGGRIASGRQWMSWIHADDLVRLIRFSIDEPLQGSVNATAPAPVTNTEFTRVLAAALHRPALLPVPGLALKMLFGEMSEVLLASQRVIPEKAIKAGFQFQYPALAPALAAVLG